MTIAFAELVARVGVEMNVIDSVSIGAQVEQAIAQTVVRLNQRITRRKVVAIMTQVGVASYALPSDFSRLIKVMTALATMGDVMVTGAGLVPLPKIGYVERYTVIGGNLVIDPVPPSGFQRLVYYGAGHFLDDEEEPAYPEMDEPFALLVVKGTKIVLLKLQLSDGSGGGWSYQIGNLTVDKRSTSSSANTVVQNAQAEYDKLVQEYIGTVMMEFSSVD